MSNTSGLEFSDEMTDDILAGISHQEVVHDLLTNDMDTNGVEMIDRVLKHIKDMIKTRLDIDMSYKKLAQQQVAISSLDAYRQVANMWKWEKCDQAGFSNAQRPDAVYEIEIDDHRMYLNVEIDGDDKKDQPQVTAMKLWQAVTFGRVRDTNLSVATLRMNLSTSRKDLSLAQNKSSKRRPLLYPGYIYTWALRIMKASVYVVGNFIAHNCRNPKMKTYSKWSKIIRDDKKVYDLHFLVGEFATDFNSLISTQGDIPDDKKIKDDKYFLARSWRHLNGCHARNEWVVGGNKDRMKNKFRPTCSHNFKLNKKFLNVYNKNSCIKITAPTTIHHGDIQNKGAPIHYFFVERVSQKDIDLAVEEISSELNADNSIYENLGPIMTMVQKTFNKRVHGMWYLQDMQHFVRQAEVKFPGDKVYQAIRGVVDYHNNSSPLEIPPDWHLIDAVETRAGDKVTTSDKCNVYDWVLEPFVSEMENMYQKLVDTIKWSLDPKLFNNDMAKHLNKLKALFNEHQIAPMTREVNPMLHLPTHRKGKTINLRDYLLVSVNEKDADLEPQMQTYITKYKSEYITCFCKLVECYNLLALHELAVKYVSGANKASLDRHIQSFSVTAQSEIRFMLDAVEKDTSILFDTPTSLQNVFIDARENPFLIVRQAGTYQYGTPQSKKDSVNSVFDMSRLKDALLSDPEEEGFTWDDQFGVNGPTNANVAKFWSQQDYFKGLFNDAWQETLIGIYSQFSDRDTDTGIEIRGPNYRLQDKIEGLATAESETITYMEYIADLLSHETSSEESEDSLGPLLFLCKVFWVFRHLALEQSDNWNKSHERDITMASDGYDQVEHGNKNLTLSKTMITAIQCVECMKVVFDNQIGNDRQGLLEKVLKFIQDMDGEHTKLESLTYNQTLRIKVFDAGTNGDLKGFFSFDPLPQSDHDEDPIQYLFTREVEKDITEYMNVPRQGVENVQSLQTRLRQPENLAKLTVFMSRTLTNLMPEIETVLKLPLVKYKYDQLLPETETLEIHKLPSQIKRPFYDRNEWFHEPHYMQWMSSSVCFRDLGFIRNQTATCIKDGEDVKLQLYQPFEMSQDETRTWNALYATCCLGNNELRMWEVEEDVKPDEPVERWQEAIEVFRRIEQARIDMLRNFKDESLRTNRKFSTNYLKNNYKCQFQQFHLDDNQKPYDNEMECKYCQEYRKQEIEWFEELGKRPDAKTQLWKRFNVAWRWKYMAISRIKMFCSQLAVWAVLVELSQENDENDEIKEKLRENKLQLP